MDLQPLTTATWPALAEFFAGLPETRWCWCMYWRRSAKDSRTASVVQQRESLRALAAGPLSPGLVALRGDRAIGWVSLGPKGDFERLQRSRVIPRLDDEPVWSIVCFAVSRAARGERLTERLLAAAVDFAAGRGARILEAYPVDVPEGGAIDANALYTGRLSVFLRAGFEVAAPTDSSAGGAPRVLVRRRLASASSVALTPGDATA